MVSDLYQLNLRMKMWITWSICGKVLLATEPKVFIFITEIKVLGSN